jgi:hypothetical protein
MADDLVSLIRDADRLPEITDGTEHTIIGVHVYMPPADDEADDRFSIGFMCESGRCLRVRLPGERLAELGKLLLELAAERQWPQ